MQRHYDDCKVAARLIEMEDEPVLYFIWQKISFIRKSEFEEKIKFAKANYYSQISSFLKYARKAHWNFIKEYVEWCLNNHLKFNTWAVYTNYSAFVKQFIMSELPRDAVERSLVYIGDKGSFGKYFKSEHLERVLLDLETGAVSPWLILLYPRNEELFNRMQPNHFYRFQKLVNTDVWGNKVSRLDKSVTSLKESLLEVSDI